MENVRGTPLTLAEVADRVAIVLPMGTSSEMIKFLCDVWKDGKPVVEAERKEMATGVSFDLGG